MYAAPTFITEVCSILLLMYNCKNDPYSEINDLYGITIVLLGCFLSQCASLLRSLWWIKFLHYISKCSKLVQLVLQIQYHVNVIYSHGDGHTNILHEKKVMLRSQVCVAAWGYLAWKLRVIQYLNNSLTKRQDSLGLHHFSL